jgi:hypothetical protein
MHIYKRQFSVMSISCIFSIILEISRDLETIGTENCVKILRDSRFMYLKSLNEEGFDGIKIHGDQVSKGSDGGQMLLKKSREYLQRSTF